MYVDMIFEYFLYSRMSSIIGCASRSFSKTSAAVERFLPVFKCSSSNNTPASCFGESMLNECPA